MLIIHNLVWLKYVSSYHVGQVKVEIKRETKFENAVLELVKQNQFAKISECSEEKDPPQLKNILHLQIICMKNAKSLN